MQRKKEIYRTGEKALTAAQVKQFLSKIGTIYDEAFFTLAITTGIRRDDIVNIKQCDFNSESGKLSFMEHKKDQILTLKLSDHAVQKLRQQVNITGRVKYLFPSPQNPQHHLSSRQAYNRFQKYLYAAGIESSPFTHSEQLALSSVRRMVGA